jgi:hypothetical protein
MYILASLTTGSALDNEDDMGLDKLFEDFISGKKYYPKHNFCNKKLEKKVKQ